MIRDKVERESDAKTAKFRDEGRGDEAMRDGR
jgi:hypothetical protein